MPKTNIGAHFLIKRRLLRLISFKCFSTERNFENCACGKPLVFSHMTRLDQSRASETISWILTDDKHVNPQQLRSGRKADNALT